MRPEEVIAAVRFEPLLPVWLIASLGVLALLVVAVAAFRRARGTIRLRAMRLSASSVPGAKPAPDPESRVSITMIPPRLM